MLVKVIICVAMVILFIVSHKSRVKSYEKWDTKSSWTSLSIITACLAVILGIILLIITLDWFFISLPLIIMYIYLLFVSEIEEIDIVYAFLLSIMVTLSCVMLFSE